MGVLKKKKKSPNWSIRQKTRKAEHSLRRQPQFCRGLTLELNGSVTCNDFFYSRFRDMKMFEDPDVRTYGG